MGTGELLSIPGNIKQMFLPFVLDNSNSMNDTEIDVAEATKVANSKSGQSVANGTHTQFFSFRPREFSDDSLTERGNFRVTPSSFYDPMRGCVDNDISYMLTYSGAEASSGSVQSARRNIAGEMLEYIPFVNVREYQHDAKLDVLLNLFQSFGSAWKDGVDAGERAAKQDQNMSWAERFWKTWDAVKQGKTGFDIVFRNLQRIIDDIFNGIGDDLKDMVDDDYTKYVLRIPYLLYYRMMSATTQNIYQLPYNGTVLYESNGGGYNTGRHIFGNLEGTESGMLGTLRNFVGKNIKINTTPTWDGADGDSGSQIELEFTLFNDTMEAAIRNFILVNTIVPNNMWMQYHVFQHAPCLYDVRIDGPRRFFMCSGQFTCEQVGQLRHPSKKFYSELDRHVNLRFSGKFKDFGTSIRIPDMYKVRCTFTSLLPNNFNNYMFQYYFDDYVTQLRGESVHTNSVANDVARNMGDELSRIYKYPNASSDHFEAAGNKPLRSVPNETLDLEERKIMADIAESNAYGAQVQAQANYDSNPSHKNLEALNVAAYAHAQAKFNVDQLKLLSAK